MPRMSTTTDEIARTSVVLWKPALPRTNMESLERSTKMLFKSQDDDTKCLLIAQMLSFVPRNTSSFICIQNAEFGALLV